VSEAEKRLALGRLRLVHRRPYYATAAFRMQAHPVKGFGTFGVDKFWRLAYDPDVILEWSVEQVASVLEHELGHLLRDHSTRADAIGIDDSTAQLFNIAADAEINDDLVPLADIDLPLDPVTPGALGLPDGQLAEWYYNNLPDHHKNPEAGDGKPGDGKSSGPECGSGAHGRAREWESNPALPEGITQVEAEIVRELTRNAVVEFAKSRGSVPSGLIRWAQTSTKPQIAWQRILAARVRSALGHLTGMNDYTRSRPSRRARVMHPVVPAALCRPNFTVAVIIDTSGSMSEDELDRAMSELSGVLLHAALRNVLLVECDAAVHARTISSRDLRKIGLHGGGGTDLRLAYDHIAAQRRTPNVVVTFTDGWTPWHEEAPFPANHIICLTSQYPDTPDWATVVEVPPAAYSSSVGAQ